MVTAEPRGELETEKEEGNIKCFGKKGDEGESRRRMQGRISNKQKRTNYVLECR